MAKSTGDINFTPEQNKIFSNLVDMFEGFVPVSTIKETVKRNKYNLDRSLAALLKIAESSSQNSASSKEPPRTETSKNHKGSENKPNNVHFPNLPTQKLNHETEDSSKGAKRKQKIDSRPKVQMPYTSQPPGNAGYSDFRKNANFYQGPPLQYKPPQRPEQMPNLPRQPNAYAHSMKNPRHGAPIIQQRPMQPQAVYAQPPNSFSNSCPPSPSHFYPNQNQNPPNKDPKEIEMAKTYDKVYRVVNDGYKIMVLMRGCPGSGKSHAANEMIQTLFGKSVDPKNHVFSADDYFVNAYGVYNFNPENLREAHQTTQSKVLAALKAGITPVIIDNTNTQSWEMKIYVPMAVAWGYYLEVLEPLTSWKFDAKMLLRKSIHNIPLYKVRDMLERYERDITGQKLLEQNSTTYPPLLTPPQLASNSPKKKFYDSMSDQNNVPKVEKVERAVNKNISEMMQSFFKNNPCKPVQGPMNQHNGPVSQNHEHQFNWRNVPSNPQISQNQGNQFNWRNVPSNPQTSQNHEHQSNWRNVPNNPMRRQVSTEFLYSPRNNVFNQFDRSGSVDNLTRSLSQTHLKENQTREVKKEFKKPKKPRKRKKPRSKVPDFSKDYVLVVEEKLVYQRDYSIYDIASTSSLKESDLNSSGTSNKEQISNISSVANEDAISSRSPSNLAKGRSNSVCSSMSNMTSLVDYSSSGSSDSEDEIIQVCSEDSFENDQIMDSPGAGVKRSTGMNSDVLDTEFRKYESCSSKDLPFDGKLEYESSSNNTDVLKTWEQSQTETGDKTDDSIVSKPPRNRIASSVSPTSDSRRRYIIKGSSSSVQSNPPEAGSLLSEEDRLGWRSETDVQSALKSWETKEEVSAKTMVEKFLKSLKEPNDPIVPSYKVNNDNCNDMATSTDYEQVSAALQGSSSDCRILECYSRDINVGLAPDPKIELQQRLHLDKGSMTEDCIPIVQSSSVDVSVLSTVFSPEVSESIAGLIDYCNGDINEVISSLIDSGHEITPEQFELLASIPKNCEDVSPSAEVKVPMKKESKVPKVATELPKQKVKQPPSKEALKLKEEFESKFKMNPDSYPKFTQQLKRQRELKQDFPSISETMNTPAPDESLVFVLGQNLIDQLQTKFGSVDLPYIKDFNPVVHIPSSLAFQLYGCVIAAAEESVSQQERLMQEIIASDRELAKQLHDSEVDQNNKMEFLDLMDMKLALQLYQADLKSLRESNIKEETIANVLSRRLLEDMFPNLDPSTLSALYRINNCSFHDTVQMVVERYEDELQLSPNLVTQKNEFSVEPPLLEPKAEEPIEENSYTIEDYKEDLSYHYQMRTKCFNQAREAYNSGKSQVASYFSQMAFLHKQKMEKASSQLIKLEIDSNLTDTLDLHFFATKDALLALDIFLDNHIKTLRSQNLPAKVLYFITGRGTHSSGGVPKVKPAVMKRLQRRNIVYKHIESNPGLLSVTVHKSLKLSSHFYDES